MIKTTKIIIITIIIQSFSQQFLSEKDHKRRRDGENKFEEIVRRMETLEEEVQFLKAENLKVHLCIIIIIIIIIIYPAFLTHAYQTNHAIGWNNSKIVITTNQWHHQHLFFWKLDMLISKCIEGVMQQL